MQAYLSHPKERCLCDQLEVIHMGRDEVVYFKYVIILLWLIIIINNKII